MSKHTPGPWKAYNADGSRNLTHWHVATQDNVGIAIVKDRDDHDGYNARLIAAAPELLQALHTILDGFIHIPDDPKGNKARTEIFKHCPYLGDATWKARCVIARAEAAP